MLLTNDNHQLQAGTKQEYHSACVLITINFCSAATALR